MISGAGKKKSHEGELPCATTAIHLSKHSSAVQGTTLRPPEQMALEAVGGAWGRGYEASKEGAAQLSPEGEQEAAR